MEVDVLGYPTTIDLSLIAQSESEIRRQLEAYEAGEQLTFDLDVSFPEGFLGSVMAAMCRIPPGEVRTYGELATELDTAPVAIGGACGRNPVGVIVPCHRVVAADGLGGFSAEGGVAAKRRLLEHEGAR